MADFADDASALSETLLNIALSRPRAPAVPFSGFCLACGDEVHERRYCDSDCRENHEARILRNRRH